MQTLIYKPYNEKYPTVNFYQYFDMKDLIEKEFLINKEFLKFNINIITEYNLRELLVYIRAIVNKDVIRVIFYENSHIKFIDNKYFLLPTAEVIYSNNISDCDMLIELK